MFFCFLFFFKVRSRQGGAEADRLSRVGLRGSEVRVTHRLNDCDCEQDTKLATPEYLCSFKVFISDCGRSLASRHTVQTVASGVFAPELDAHTVTTLHMSVRTDGRTDERKETATGRREFSQRP